MPEKQILILGPALDSKETAESLEMLGRVKLPSASRYVVTSGKFETAGQAKTFNAEGGYPAEPAHLKALAAWAEIPYHADPHFRDGYDIFCLRSLLSREQGFTYAVLLRHAGDFQERWPELRTECESRSILAFQSATPDAPATWNLLLHIADKRTPRLLEFMSDLYATGAAYGLTPYSLERAVGAAFGALQFEERFFGGRDGHTIGGLPLSGGEC